jgi:heat shock protein HslJ
MSNIARLAGSALLLCALTACGGANNTVPVKQEAPPPGAAGAADSPAAAVAADQPPADPPTVERTRWSLRESRLASPPPDETDDVRLEFHGDRLSANSGCNLGSGTFRFEDDVLVVGPMATTRRACVGPAAAYEAAFFAFLSSRPHARLEADGDELVLESTAGANKGILRFRTQPMPSANAVEKFIYVASTRVPCTGVATTECLQVRATTSEPWRAFYGEIIGFTPERGIEYRLRVLEDPVPNPPADASSKRWYLDLVVEQKIVTP